MTSFHVISDGFAAGQLSYGLGMEGVMSGGKPSPMSVCGATLLGHGGLDYGSGAPVGGFLPELRLGVSVALGAAREFGSTTTGKNCSLSYSPQKRAQNEAVEAVMAVLMAAVGRDTPCTLPSHEPPPLATCTDAAYFGVVNGQQTSCAAFLASASASSHQAVGDLCDSFLGMYTIEYLEKVWAPQYHMSYQPPPGYDASLPAVDLCKKTCMDAGAGPCWLHGKQTPWCD